MCVCAFLTLIGMLRLWFHCGLAFFSKILVQTWKTNNPCFFICQFSVAGCEITISLVNIINGYKLICTVLPAKWISTRGSTKFFLLLSNPRKCLIPSMKASSTSDRDTKQSFRFYVSSTWKQSQTVTTHSEAGLQLWDPQSERGSSQRQTSRPQQVWFDILFILHTLTFVSLETHQSTNTHSS